MSPGYIYSNDTVMWEVSSFNSEITFSNSTGRRNVSRRLGKSKDCTNRQKKYKNLLKTIDLSLRLICNYLFNYFIENKHFLQSVNLIFFNEAIALLNNYQLPMKFTKILTVTLRQMLEGLSSMFWKLLIRFSMKVYLLNCSLVE